MSDLDIQADNFSLTSSLEEGLVFLHIEIDKMNKATLLELRSSMQDFKESCFSKGHDVIFATTSNEKTTKFWEMVEPCYEVRQLDETSWLGAWLTKEI